MIEGSCLCGTVKFALRQAPSFMGTCHCSRCRKAGASTIAFVRREDLVWHQGREAVTRHIPAAPYRYSRCFCSQCGTALGEILSDQDSFPIPMNALDTPLDLQNQFHVFTAEKPAWLPICDTAPQFEGQPPEG